MVWKFSKMHGAGNDFVVLDCRENNVLPDADTIRLMGDRHFGIGFDQLLTVELPIDAARGLQRWADQTGQTEEAVAVDILTRHLALKEINADLAAHRQDVVDSGMSDEETEAIFKAALEEVRAERRARFGN